MYACTMERVEKLGMKVMLLKALLTFNFWPLSAYVFKNECPGCRVLESYGVLIFSDNNIDHSTAFQFTCLYRLYMRILLQYPHNDFSASASCQP